MSKLDRRAEPFPGFEAELQKLPADDRKVCATCGGRGWTPTETAYQRTWRRFQRQIERARALIAEHEGESA